MRTVAVCLSLCFATAVNAEALQVEPGRALRVAMDGQAVVESDAVALADFEAAAFEASGKLNWLSGGDPDQCAFYREVAEHDDRIEINWVIRYGPYRFGRDIPGETFNAEAASYDLHLASEAAEGAAFAAMTGSPLAPKAQQGVLESGRDGVVLDELLFITFTKNGRSVTFDLNPPGAHTQGHYSLWSERWWRLERVGGGYVIRAHFRRINWGDTRWFKVLIAPGVIDYDKVHTRSKRGFGPLLFPERIIDCAAKTRPPHAALAAEPYSVERGMGWIDPAGVDLVKTPGEESFYAQQLRGAGRRTLRVDLSDGVYLVTALFGGAEASGPVDVYANKQQRLTAHQVDAGRFSAQTFHATVESGQVELTFDGARWLLAALSFTPLLSPWEDYLFARDWFNDPSRFNAWYETVEDLSPPPPVTQGPIADDPLTATWHGHITTYAGSNDGSRTDLGNSEAAAYRVRELAGGGFGWIMINGAHMRFSFHRRPRNNIIQRNTALAVRTAHERGMKVIEHFDMNWAYYPGYPAMIDLLEQDPSCLQRQKNPLIVSTAFCPNSEAFLQRVIDYVVDFQKKTNVDGMMIDEINWIRADYCFCDTCRTTFERDTGLALPNHVSSMVESDQPLWIAYVKWRGRRTMQFVSQVRAALRSVRPDAIMLSYTSNYLSRPNSRGYQYDEDWAVDYFGDEFHPDLVLQNWRVMFARMKGRQAIARSWGLAGTWILPKFRSTPSRTLYAWALGRMNRANLWVRADDYDWARRLNAWPARMDDANSTLLSDVAVLLSDATRDLRADPDYYHTEYHGWIQTLAEQNVQYDVLLERDIERGLLKRYPVLLLANVASLSDTQAQAIANYAAAGGWVVASFETGFFDESGHRRETPALAQVMNLRLADQRESPAVVQLSASLGGAVLETPSAWYAVQLIDANRSQVLATIDGAPAVLRTPHGKGGFYYLAGRFAAQNYEDRAVSERNRTTLQGQVSYKTNFNPQVNVFADALLDHALGENRHTRAASMPRGIIYTAYREHDNIVLHLLNCQGKPALKFGDTYPAPADEPQPPVESELVFELRTELQLRDAIVASPERDQTTQAKVESLGGNRYRVTVPGEALTGYTLVRVR